MGLKQYTIALCGAFDINSYGDSLFPLAFEYEMRKRLPIKEIVLFAPKGKVECISYQNYVHAFADLQQLHEQYRFDAVVIGGGELLHFDELSFKRDDGSKIVYQEAELWETPVSFALKNGIPYMFNSVGAPHCFTDFQKEKLQRLFHKASYISVRDRFSFERIHDLAKDIYMVPDCLWNLNRYLSKGDSILDHDYFVIQYGTQFKMEELFSQIKVLQQSLGLRAILIPINYCHEDRIIAEKAREVIGDEVVIFDRQLNVEEIYNIISNARFFVGTSLHGTLTALSNDVYSVIIDMYPTFVGKMDGILNWMEYTIPMISDVNSLLGIIDDNNTLYQAVVSSIKKKTDLHYDAMSQIILEG